MALRNIACFGNLVKVCHQHQERRKELVSVYSPYNCLKFEHFPLTYFRKG